MDLSAQWFSPVSHDYLSIFRVLDPLSDCTDISAKYLENKYIHDMGSKGTLESGVVKVTTLSIDRT